MLRSSLVSSVFLCESIEDIKIVGSIKIIKSIEIDRFKRDGGRVCV